MKNFLRVYGAPIAIVVLGLVVAFMFMSPAPPKRIVIAGGGAGGAYAATADAYAKTLDGFDVEVEVLETAGSVDNLARVKSGPADVGIVQTGLASDLGQNGVRTLGAVYYEPLWIFHRSSVRVESLQSVAGRRVAIGPEGSGVRVLATLLLTEAGVAPESYTAAPLAGQAAAAALQAAASSPWTRRSSRRPPRAWAPSAASRTPTARPAASASRPSRSPRLSTS